MKRTMETVGDRGRRLLGRQARGCAKPKRKAPGRTKLRAQKGRLELMPSRNCPQSARRNGVFPTCCAPSDCWERRTQSARPHEAPGAERQARITAIAQLPEKRKGKPDFPHLIAVIV